MKHREKRNKEAIEDWAHWSACWFFSASFETERYAVALWCYPNDRALVQRRCIIHAVRWIDRLIHAQSLKSCEIFSLALQRIWLVIITITRMALLLRLSRHTLLPRGVCRTLSNEYQGLSFFSTCQQTLSRTISSQYFNLFGADILSNSKTIKLQHLPWRTQVESVVDSVSNYTPPVSMECPNVAINGGLKSS